MAFLQFENGKKFYLTHPVNIISNQLIAGANTCVLDDHTIQQKHCAITSNSKGMFRLIDMCSNYQTFLKEETASRYESLEPLEYHLLRDSDFIRFGLVVVKFRSTEVVESSQLTETMTSTFGTAKSKFFVPETQDLNTSLGDQPERIEDMPATEQLTEGFRFPRMNPLGAPQKGLNVIKERDETCTNTNGNSSKKLSGSTKNVSNDLSSDEDETFHSLEDSKAFSKAAASRDGSITPDLNSDRDGSVTPDIILMENSQREESLNHKPAIPQSMIETDDSGTDDEREDRGKCNPSIFDPTQPFFFPIVRTRFQQKRQAEIKPKVVSLTDFDFTQKLEEDPPLKKACFALETQPFLLDVPETANVSARTVNRILMSSDEDSVEKPEEAEHEACQVNEKPNLPEKLSESPVKPIPRLPSLSQSGTVLDLSNASLASAEDSDATVDGISQQNSEEQIEETILQESETMTGEDFEEKPEEAEHKACEINVEPSTPEKRSESPFGIDPETPDIFLRLPSDSQLGAVLDLANASQASIDSSGVTAEEVSPRNESGQDKENVWQQPRQEFVEIKKKPRRRIMKYDSDDEAGPSTRVKVKKRPKKSCSILISNGTAELNDAVKNAIETLDGKIVERVAEADVLVTQDKLKLTAKILATICRRVPIVSVEYLQASLLAGGWLDSKLFIICDEKIEARKQFSLKAAIQSSQPKIFEKYSVFSTAGTNIPRDQLSEIIESAGGEYLGSIDHQPTRDNVAVIFSSRDEEECEEICEKYENILKILDTRFVTNVLSQKL